MLAKRPELDNYVQLNRENTRRQFTLFDGSCDAGDDERRALWKLVSDVLASPEIEGALREVLDEGFRIRAKGSHEEWPVKMYPRPVVYTDFDGYAIKPHPDTRRKVLTMLVYMPEDDSQIDLGTTLYKISPMGVFAWKSYGLVEEKTVPFLPNTGMAFVVIHPRYNLLKTSWHGRGPIAGAAGKAALFAAQRLLRQAGHRSRLLIPPRLELVLAAQAFFNHSGSQSHAPQGRQTPHMGRAAHRPCAVWIAAAGD